MTHFRFSSLLSIPLFSLLFTVIAQDDAEHQSHSRKPLPSAEEIAKLPEDGGEEFNRLVFEKSPYLLQHARNPVDWWPWGEAAFAKAKKEGKPVLLSVGYTTCHWCHVMEHESFEDAEVAKLLNEKFVAIKVDREERPDIDEIYMTVTQAMTGRGGWPMNVLMTSDKKPFFAGTYFPKDSRAGRPGFIQILERMTDAWETDQAGIIGAADSVAQELQGFLQGSPGGTLDEEIYDKAFQQYFARYDAELGGFGSAPKFPTPQNLMFLLRYHKQTGDAKPLEMVEQTLTEMRKGGVYDHIGFGTHRYSTDREWLLPHFEKMLYDQALLSMANLEAYQVTGKEKYAETAREIFTYVLRDMTSETGGFYSAEDADSEGEEGTFYIWTPEEITDVLGEENGAFFNATFNITPGGNFADEATGERNGSSIPHLRKTLSDEEKTRIDALRAKLFDAREKRVHPQKDDKILTDWNGLMIAAFSMGAQVLGEEEYAEAAKKAADFVLETLKNENGQLLKRYRDGEAGLTAHLQDYTFMTWGLLNLYETNFDVAYLEKAKVLTDYTLDHFWDQKGDGFFMTSEYAEQIIVRIKKLVGGAIPSGNSISMLNLARLYRMTGDAKYRDKADELAAAFSKGIESGPSQVPLFLAGLQFHNGPSYEVLFSAESANSEDSKAMIDAARKPFIPNKVMMFRTPENAETLGKLAPFSATMSPINGKATAYVCLNQACDLPTNEIEKMLESLTRDRKKKSESDQ